MQETCFPQKPLIISLDMIDFIFNSKLYTKNLCRKISPNMNINKKIKVKWFNSLKITTDNFS